MGKQLIQPTRELAQRRIVRLFIFRTEAKGTSDISAISAYPLFLHCVGACCPSGLQWNFLSSEAIQSMVVPGNTMSCGSKMSSQVKKVLGLGTGASTIADVSWWLKFPGNGADQLAGRACALLCCSTGREAGRTALEQYSVTCFVPRKNTTSPRKEPVAIRGLRLCTL